MTVEDKTTFGLIILALTIALACLGGHLRNFKECRAHGMSKFYCATSR
jgi:hypothetical protein